MKTKECTRCKKRKPVSAYSVDNQRSDRLYPQCRPCKYVWSVIRQRLRLRKEPNIDSAFTMHKKMRSQTERYVLAVMAVHPERALAI